MKKKLLALALVAIGISMVAYETLAYFTASDTAHNVITSDAINIEIVEWTLKNGEKVPYPKDEPIAIMPGVTVSKIVTVENKEAQAYIRADFEVTVRNAEGEVMELTEETLERIIQIVPNSEYWLTNTEEDGWFYYKEPVGTAKATEPLFSEVAFSGVHMTNEYQNCKVEINVVAQAVQTANNGSKVMEAAGWPEAE